MMSTNKSLLLAALMSALLLHLCSKSEAASNFDCCLGYREQALHPKMIVNYTEQRANEACDINAIIFHTRRKLNVCADPKKKWVKHVLRILSFRAKKM
ncbi:C-C motif chemokine ligand 20 [Rhinolophus ferrumequinum]|uniref:C-C motif chemokine n=1 Tax=Rhinolophus ferrumequinum TaxID=59479 RepID=A0A7J7YHR1_RHIFE|nr:C-C motif chemokine 20 isoform X1 [Rhinolophus ferrumequinum]KAF6361206.1 C-C motif chemokine ligand 20 [Rhinolophus ferrumequinum]